MDVFCVVLIKQKILYKNMIILGERTNKKKNKNNNKNNTQ